METTNPNEALDISEKEADSTVVTPKTIHAFAALAVALKRIHIRLIAEGYIIQDGIITKSEKLKAYEADSNPHRKNR